VVVHKIRYVDPPVRLYLEDWNISSTVVFHWEYQVGVFFLGPGLSHICLLMLPDWFCNYLLDVDLKFGILA